MIRIPTYIVSNVTSLNRVRNKFYQEHGREATAKELSKTIGISLVKVKEMLIALEMRYNVLKKPYRSQTAVLLAAALAVLMIHLFALVVLVAVLPSIVQRHNSSFDFILDGVIRSSQMFGNTVDRPSVLQSNFNFV